MSTSFVEFAIEDASLRDHFKFDCKWSVAGQYLAVSTYSKDQGGSLTIVSESGTVLEADQLVQKLSGNQSKLIKHLQKKKIKNNFFCLKAFKVDSKINAFEWHPKLAVVACFWDNQVLGCFSVQPNQQRWIYSENESNRTEETKATEETVGPKSRIKSAILNHFKVISMLWLNDGEELFTGEMIRTVNLLKTLQLI